MLRRLRLLAVAGLLSATTVVVVLAAPPTIDQIADLNAVEDAAIAPIAFNVADPDGDTLTISVASSDPAIVASVDVPVGPPGPRTLTIASAPDANTAAGPATITLTVSDGIEAPVQMSFLLDIAPQPDSPVIAGIGPQTTPEDTPLSVPVAVTDADVGDAITVTATSSDQAIVPDANLVATPLTGPPGARSLMVTPRPDQHGQVTITVAVSDGVAPATATQFVLTVTPVNDAPTVAPVTPQNTMEDTPVSVVLNVGDVDNAPASLAVTAVSSTDPSVVPLSNIAISPGSSDTTRNVVLTPAANASGTTRVTFEVSDGTAQVSTAFDVVVSAVNDPPVIQPIGAQSTSEDTPLTVTIDVSDGDGDTLTVSATSSDQTVVPNAGLVVTPQVGPAGQRSLTVTPAANQDTSQSGPVTITVSVDDGGSTSVSTQFVLSIVPVNDPPTTVQVPGQTTQEDTPVALTLTVGDVDDDPGALTVTATATTDAALLPTANVAIAAGGSPTTRTITLTPVANQSGAATVTLTISDGTSATAATIALTVTPVNDPPTISDIGPVSTNLPNPTPPVPITVGDQETAPGSLTLSAALSGSTIPGAQPTFVFGGSGSARTIVLTPNGAGTGKVTVRVTVSDGTASAYDDFEFTVNAASAPTVTLSDASTRSVSEDTPSPALAPQSFTIADADTPVQNLVVTATSSNTALVPNSSLVLSSGGTSTRTVGVTNLNPNANGQTTITITVTDNQVPAGSPPNVATTSFVLNVTPVNDPPTASSIASQSTSEDQPVGPIVLTVGDVDTPPATLSVSATATTNATLLPVGNVAIVAGSSATTRDITLTPAPNRSGTATVTLTISDGTASITRAISLTVNADNDAPTISPIGNQSVDEDTPTAALSFQIGDAETAVGALTLSASSSNTTLVPVGNIVFGGSGASRTVRVTPATNRSGSTTITVSVSDGTKTASESFLLTVGAADDPPTIALPGAPQGGFTTQEDVPLAGASAIPFVVGDAETAVSSLTVQAVSSDTTLVPNAGLVVSGSGTTRTLAVTPLANRSGSTTVTLRVSDGSGAPPVSTQFLVRVTPVNDPPVVSVVPAATVPKNGSATVSFQVSDVDDPATALALTASSSNDAIVNDGAQTSLVFGGGGAARTLTITPVLNAIGPATITVRAVDAGLATGVSSFAITVADVPCTYAATPARVALGPSSTVRFVTVTTAGGCGWALVTEAAVPWLSLSTTGTVFGNGAVSIAATDNDGAGPREATLVLQQRDEQGGVIGTPSTIVVSQDGPVSGDADGDGLPSHWERQFGLDALSGSPTDSSDPDGARGDPDGDGLTNLQEFETCEASTADGKSVGCTHPRGALTSFLAEGAQNSFFRTQFALLNPGGSEARVLLRFQKADGNTVTEFVAVPPMSRRTVQAQSVAGLDPAEFATLVESDQPVVVDRRMTWDMSGYGSHAETGISAPQTTWYLAEGATIGSFELFYLVQNPSLTQKAEIEVEFLLPSGNPVVKTYTVGEGSRFNIWVNTIPELADAELSGVIRATNGVPILVERAMYLTSAQQAFAAGHASAAVAEPSTQWFLAEGATGDYFDLFVLIANPNDAAAQLEVDYLLPDGTVITKPYEVGSRSRFNIWVDLEDTRLASAAVSTVVRVLNGVPVIVERAMWWPGPSPATWSEAHNSAATTRTAERWALADGEQGGAAGAETYVLIANTSGHAGQARVRLVIEGAGTVERTFDLPSRSRTNVAIGSEFPEAAGKTFGVVVESLGTTPAQLVVERAIYTSPGGVQWAAGSNAVATPLP
jgi:hypothetical protein